MPNHDDAIANFLTASGWEGAERVFLAGDASFRHYERVQDVATNRTAVLMDAPPEKEPLAPFILVDHYLVERGYSAPQILAQEREQGFLLLEDLGDDSFTRLLKMQPHQEQKIYLAATDVLVKLHQQESPEEKPTLEVSPYNQAKLLEEVALFTDWYLVAQLGEEKANALRASYLAVWQDIIAVMPWLPSVVVLRDYHADNLLWLPEREGEAQVGLLDFQDALIGSPAYDLVSLLEDARRDVPPEIVQMSINRYLQKMNWNKSDFMLHYALLGAQRNSKIIGIFTRLAKRDGKNHYLSLLPRVWAHLQHDLRHPVLRPLKEWLDVHLPVSQRGIPEWNGDKVEKLSKRG
jgi:aminoglycoside/choline kinase family phosphotransferase